MWDWLPGPSGLWNYLSQTPEADWLRQYPERYRNQILQGLMDWAETTRGGSPVGTSAHLLSALNPVRPLASDALLKVGEDVADKANRYQQWAAAKAERTGLPVPDYNEMTAQQGAFIPSLALSATGLGRTKVAGDAVRDFIGKTKFYSPTRRALAKAQDKATGKQYIAAVKKEPGASKEAREGGLIELLEQAPGTITKEQALSMWNPVELTETVKGGKPIIEQFSVSENEEGLWDISNSSGEVVEIETTRAAAEDAARQFGQGESAAVPRGGLPKYADDKNLNLPGGTNAKEILVQYTEPLPTELPEGYAIKPLSGHSLGYKWTLEKPDGSGTILSSGTYEEALNDALTQIISPEITHKYRGGHYDEPNVLAHIRTNERDVGGRKALHIEEIQSDWHQQGQKKGYGMGATDAEVKAAAAILRERSVAYETKRAELVAILKEEAKPFVLSEADLYTELSGNSELDALNDQVHSASQNAQSLRRAQFEGVPDAPFKKNWHELAFKRALTEAVNDPSIERLTWTTGAVQADRYDLSKQISEVHLSGSNFVAYDHDGNTVIKQTGVRDEDLPELIGKEAAEKLLAQPRQGTLRSLTGQDLQVGGEFHKNLYDKKITQFAKKFLKKYGVEPQLFGQDLRSEILAAAQAHHYVQLGNIQMSEVESAIAELQKDPIITTNPNAKAAWSLLREVTPDSNIDLNRFHDTRNKVDEFWYIDITPEMREEIMTQGVPLTQRRKQMGLMAGYA